MQHKHMQRDERRERDREGTSDEKNEERYMRYILNS